MKPLQAEHGPFGRSLPQPVDSNSALGRPAHPSSETENPSPRGPSVPGKQLQRLITPLPVK